ncbi:sulfite exporter TauE/SafE family protein [Peribacillus alkalitolerans]|uniref:sulfite exporter TauE/SafE family protein n=1 Tax=Peribacillus alkalitolerans TaxID=1550385 RepID=UPI0013CFAC39|nr:sulfite exporter TauE/SafE family protein [Peribacillus alkalitolerans]
MEWIVLLIIIGLSSGTIGSLIGLGGGIIIVPALLFFSSASGLLTPLTPQVAVGVSTVVMIFTGLSSTLAYMKHKTVDYKSGFIFFAGSALGGILGALMNKHMELDDFNLYFGIFVILISLVLMIKDRLKPVSFKETFQIKRVFKDPDGKEFHYGYNVLPALLISIAVGFCSGLFGIGGGSLIVPAMILLFLFPPHVAVATSMFLVFLSSMVNSVTHISLGNVNWAYAAALIPGAWFGAKLGAYINKKLTSKSLVNILRIMLLIIGIRLIYQGIIG